MKKIEKFKKSDVFFQLFTQKFHIGTLHQQRGPPVLLSHICQHMNPVEILYLEVKVI